MDKTVTLSVGQRLAIGVMFNRMGDEAPGGRTVDVKTGRARRRLRKVFGIIKADESIDEVLVDELELAGESVPDVGEKQKMMNELDHAELGPAIRKRIATALMLLWSHSLDPTTKRRARRLERDFEIDADNLRWLKVEMEQHNPLLQWADDHLDAIDQIDQAFATKLEAVEAAEG